MQEQSGIFGIQAGVYREDTAFLRRELERATQGLYDLQQENRRLRGVDRRRRRVARIRAMATEHFQWFLAVALAVIFLVIVHRVVGGVIDLFRPLICSL